MINVTISGPYDAKGPGDTPSRRRIFVCRPSGESDEMPCAKKILSTLQRRAYRRPVTDSDLDDLLPFYTAGRADGGFEMGIQKALERMLVSPQFLFRIEREPPAVGRISDLELASRLSFFLWSSIPDDELLDAAAKGRLKDPAVLGQQVQRMLADPRSESLVTNFAAQWLFLRDVAAKQPDVLMFPDFDDGLRNGFERETELFLDSILRENRSVLDLLTANYTFLNERLAKHYGIPNVEGTYFRRYTFPDGSVRGGLLGQGSILTLTSYATRTSPVLRGKWVLENLLSDAPPPPPPNVPALKTEVQAGRRDAFDAGGHDAASRQSGLRGLPCSHGSHRLRHGELRRGRTVAGRRVRQPDRLFRRVPRWDQVRRDGGTAQSPAQPSRSVCRHHRREAVDVRNWPQFAIL